MRFAVIPYCLFHSIAALPAMAEGVAGGTVGAGLRAATDSEGAAGFARLTFDAPLTEDFGLRGRLDIAEAEVGDLADIGIGAGIWIDREDWVAFADLRYGTGSTAAVAVTGIDLLARSGALTLGAGPRLSL